MNSMNKTIKLSTNLNKMVKLIQVYKENSVLKKVLKPELNLTAIKEATSLLKDGKIIALPTDTIYGIACLAENNDSLKKLYEIKQRDLMKPIAICVNNLDDIYKWGKVTVDRQILNELLPGPVTLVFERSEMLNKNLNPSTNLIGIRIPDDAFVYSLTFFNNPLVLTSANLSSETSASTIQEFKKIWPKLDAIFDAGQLNHSDPFHLGSTVVDLSVSNKFKIIRKGCAIDKVLKVLKDKYSFEELI